MLGKSPERVSENVSARRHAKGLPVGLLKWFLCATELNPSRKTAGENIFCLPEGCVSRASFPDCCSVPPNADGLPPNLQFSVCNTHMHTGPCTHSSLFNNIKHADVHSRVNRLIPKTPTAIWYGGVNPIRSLCAWIFYIAGFKLVVASGCVCTRVYLRMLSSSLVAKQLLSALAACCFFTDSSSSSTWARGERGDIWTCAV